MCTLKTSHVLVAHPSLDVAGSRADLRQHAKTYGHSVIFSGNAGTGAHGNSIRLHEPDPHELEKALQESGYDSERARQIAARCGGRIPGLKRLLLDLSASPEWASGIGASELALAVLIGRWDANRTDDVEAVEDALGKSYGEWIHVLRPMTLRPDPPLIQRDERWKFVSRFEGWQALGRSIFDADIERFERVALRVLGERDPKLKLAPDDRWKFMPDTKRRRYSDILREGLAETLALLGSFPKSMSSCSVGRPEATAAVTVRRLFERADWELWATLNDILPLLAEAAPEQFLRAVETSLGTEADNPFIVLFKQERAGISGRNYMTGLLWALETLAWNPDYLVRVSLILGELAAIDPGGNWSNRPSNSLVDILLPWHPQTVADIPKRTAAVSTVLSEQREVGWKLVLALLPGAHGVTSGTRRPTWREYIPNSWKDTVTNRDYRDQVVAYANLAVEVAMADNSKLVELLEHIPSLPDSGRRRLFDYIGSTQVTRLPESERRPIWESLVKLVSVHRQYAGADWAMDADSIALVEQAARAIAPESSTARYHRLFGGLEFELFEEKEDYETQHRKLAVKREDAVREILESLGLEGVVAFARSVDAPSKVGAALGVVGDEALDRGIIPALLGEQDLHHFTSGFVWERVRTRGWEWVEQLPVESWTKDAKITFLMKLPFQKRAWQRATSLLGDDISLYWKQVYANPYQLDENDLVVAAEILLQCERPRAAIQCLNRAIYAKVPVTPALVIDALRASVSSEEPLNAFDQHATRHLIKWLQANPETEEQELFHVEWSYLPLLDRLLGQVTPKTLEGRLARDPAFFCEVIRSTFRSDKEEPDTNTPTADKKRIAQNAYRLLRDWQTPPGTTPDETWSESAFAAWLSAVKKSTTDSGHYGVAMSQVGQVLTYVQGDPSGLWIHKTVAASLDGKDAQQMRSGFTIKLFNRRGTYGFTAGCEEREIAAGYRRRADAVENAGYSRLAASLRDLAKSFEQEAERDAARGAIDE